MTHRGPFQPVPFCVILCDSMSLEVFLLWNLEKCYIALLCLKCICKRTFRCRLLSMPSLSTAEVAKIQLKAELGTMFVLQQLMLGTRQTRDVVETGRQPCRILNLCIQA